MTAQSPVAANFETASGTSLPWRVVQSPMSEPLRSIVDGNGIYVAMSMQPAVAVAIVNQVNNPPATADYEHCLTFTAMPKMIGKNGMYSDIRSEDSGQAAILETNAQGTVFVRIQSWQEGPSDSKDLDWSRFKTTNHPEMRSMIGKTVTVTVKW